MLKLPENPSEDQVKAVTLALLESLYEDNIESVGDIEPYGDNGWQTTFRANGTDFEVTYDGETMTKQVAGVETDGVYEG
jgi:hypothetical protein